jgi:hypothetical protein
LRRSISQAAASFGPALSVSIPSTEPDRLEEEIAMTAKKRLLFLPILPSVKARFFDFDPKLGYAVKSMGGRLCHLGQHVAIRLSGDR